MNKMVEYGLICESKEEKQLMAALQHFMEPMNRTFAKTKNKGLLEARLPYVYKHYYWNLNKEKQVYIEIYPNKDAEGKCKFSDGRIGWILFANCKDLAPPYDVPLDEQEKYIQDILTQTGLEYVTLYEYKEGEERL